MSVVRKYIFLIVVAFLACRITFMFAQWWAFEAASCPRNQTLNEDNTYSLHVTPPLRKHFVMHSAAVTRYLTTRMPVLWFECRHVWHWHWCGGPRNLVHVFYSYLKLSIGFVLADFTVFTLIVRVVSSTRIKTGTKNSDAFIGI